MINNGPLWASRLKPYLTLFWVPFLAGLLYLRCTLKEIKKNNFMAVHKTCQLPTRLKHFSTTACLILSLSPFFLFNAEQHSRKLTLNSALKLRRHSGFSAFFVLSLSPILPFVLVCRGFFFFFRCCCSSFLFGLIPFFQLRSLAVRISALGSSRI